MRPPRTTGQAAELLDCFAALDARIAEIEANRRVEVGQINAAADAVAATLIEERQKIAAQLEPWWRSRGPELTPKGRKSIQLGGCMIGMRAKRPVLAHGFDQDDQAVEALRSTRLANQTTRIKYSLDRAATLKLLQSTGKAAETLVGLGFRVEQGELFYIERVEQAGTIGS
ncbi:MAG TPA: host-nuclease inhibitor Gam family protein [Allosphingosinicella sp.]